jgi:hypothetical protein
MLPDETSVEYLMNWSVFTIGFWHPFGSHGGETRDQILERKASEANENGWTLWSFQHRTEEMIGLWLNEIRKAQPKSVFVLCSDSRGTINPRGEIGSVKEYRFADSNDWKPIPPKIKIPHPSQKPNATGFIVKRVIPPQQLWGQPSFYVELLRRDGIWLNHSLYSRPEFMIRTGGNLALRPVYAVLELETPYIAQLRK